MGLHGVLRYCTVLHGVVCVIASDCMVFHGIAWCCFFFLHGIAGFRMVLQGFARYCMVLHGIALHCMMLHGVA